jgi:hypothetical protein
MAGKKTKNSSAKVAAKANESSSSSSSSSNTNNTKPKTVRVDGEELSLEESLERAQIALEMSEEHMLSLHMSWRSQLQRISAVVLMLVLKQSSIPAYSCMDEVQSWNERITERASTGSIGHWETGKLCIADSLMEISGVLCCLSLVWLVCQPLQRDDFSSLPFRSAVFFVPLIVASYCSNPMVGCLKEDLAAKVDRAIIESEGAEPGTPRTFPIVLILMVGCFGSLYMMQYQQKQQTENIQKIGNLRENLIGSSREKKKN